MHRNRKKRRWTHHRQLSEWRCGLTRVIWFNGLFCPQSCTNEQNHYSFVWSHSAFSGPSISAPLGDMEWRLCIWTYHQSLQIKIVTCNDLKYITSGHIKIKRKVHSRIKYSVFCSPRHSLNSVVGLIWVVNIRVWRGGVGMDVWWRRVVDRCWNFGEHPEKQS